jgi:hypothetical protein
MDFYGACRQNLAAELLVEEEKKFVPDFHIFRDFVDGNCKFWEKQEEVAIKLMYLLGARASELITKVSPKQRQLGMTKPYGSLLRWEFVNYKMKNGQDAKILLVHSAIAKAGKTLKPETSPEIVNALAEQKKPDTVICPMKEIPIPISPQNIEPWGSDIIRWIQTKGEKAKADPSKAMKEALRFDVTEMTMQNWVWKNLRKLAPDKQPQYFSRFNRMRKPIHPHSLRTWRVTHLKDAYHFNTVEQCAFTRWTVRSQEARRGITVSSNIDIYSQLSWRDFIDKLLIPITEI